MQSPMERLKSLIPDIDGGRDGMLQALLDSAEEYILAYCNRAALPERMRWGQVRLALLYYNRAGIEGESARSEGGVSRSVEALPADLLAWLNAHRLFKITREEAMEP